MVKKMLLSCAEPKALELLGRFLITVGESSDDTTQYKGWSDSSFGSMSVIEGELVILDISDQATADDQGFQLTCSNDYGFENGSSLTIENETTGVKLGVTFVVGMFGMAVFMGNYGLYDGVEVGQECIIAVYK